MLSVYFVISSLLPISCFFFFNDTATTEIYTLSLHDALPISDFIRAFSQCLGLANLDELRMQQPWEELILQFGFGQDRKSTRLNSSHLVISYAVFCLKKKKKKKKKYYE